MKKLIFITSIILLASSLFSQEALKSTEEEYYDFLSLQGIVERPTLGYRTLSDSVWNLDDSQDHVWQNNNLGTIFTFWEPENPSDNAFTRGIKQGIFAKVYGPEWYNSYNSAAPHGQNDGALWQGRGYNTALTGGIRLEGYGFELTFKPQVSFSQNMEFELLPSNYDSDFGYLRGLAHNIGIDAPQRFGDLPFWNYDWGDSEIRWTWNTITIGFGTQLPWIGPSQINPILHSNNAPGYPKIDIGIRKTDIIIPFIKYNIGKIEFRSWVGFLEESQYFDLDNSNNNNMINGFIFVYEPSFIDDLSFGVCKICLSKWMNDSNFLNYFNPFYSQNSGIHTDTGEDQKASLFFNWTFTSIGLNLYGEIGIDDYLQGGLIYGALRYPFDTLIYTLGIKKVIQFNSPNYSAEIMIEISNMEESRNRIAANSPYTFNMHHQIIQGFTNKGQYIGTYLANGGNSQAINFNFYYPKGNACLTLQRYNPDNTFSYSNHAGNNTYKSNFLIKVESDNYLFNNLKVTSGLIFDYIINSNYFKIENSEIIETENVSNWIFILGIKYIF